MGADLAELGVYVVGLFSVFVLVSGAVAAFAWIGRTLADRQEQRAVDAAWGIGLSRPRSCRLLAAPRSWMDLCADCTCSYKHYRR